MMKFILLFGLGLFSVGSFGQSDCHIELIESSLDSTEQNESKNYLVSLTSQCDFEVKKFEILNRWGSVIYSESGSKVIDLEKHVTLSHSPEMMHWKAVVKFVGDKKKKEFTGPIKPD